MPDTSCTLNQTAESIRNLISNSTKFLKIVTFRFDSTDFAQLILDRARNNVDVEIVTNPSDNVAKDQLRPIVESMYKELEDTHVKLYLCSWEAGEPELTNTSMSGKQSASAGIGEKWYSLHLQIYMNEKELLVTSRPLTADKTMDVFYRTADPYLMNEAIGRFEEIKKLFIKEKQVNGLAIPGNVVDFLDVKMLEETIQLYMATKRLNARQYSMHKLPESKLVKGLFITPFDGRMRSFLYHFIDSADKYVYFFLETLFDEELISKLQEKRAANPQLQIKIITCPPQRIRQSPQKARALVGRALSSGIQIGNRNDIQAKFWISDKWLAISSGDFNRMNLGHNTTNQYWKSDTQLILLDDKGTLIDQIKKEFELNFQPIDQGSICAPEAKVLLARVAKNHQLSASSQAYSYLSRFKSMLLMKTENDVAYVLDIAVTLARNDGKRKLEGFYMLAAILIYILQRREHTLSELVEKLEGIESKAGIERTINLMKERGQVIRSGDIYRIAPNLNLKPDVQRAISRY